MHRTCRVTVSMPARNAERFIGQAIASVLLQREVEFELIVVDDASVDRTVDVVVSFDDPRVRLVRNTVQRGVAYCHNVVIDQSRAPYIAHVDADDVLMPGALQAVVEKLESDPRLGQVHCHYFFIDEYGRTTREQFRAGRRALLGLHRCRMDYKRNLLVHGMVANCLRTYRREVFGTVGRFDETRRIGVDYDMSLRLVDRYEIGLVPAFLYAIRLHGTSLQQRRRFRLLRYWVDRFRHARRLGKTGGIRFLDQKPYRLTRLMLLGLGHVLRIPKVLHAIAWRTRWIAHRNGPVGRTVRRVAEFLYYLAVDRMSWWPLHWWRRPQGITANCIGWYLWRFPVLSETFIRREMMALADEGFEVRVFADDAADLEFADGDARTLLTSTDFLTPIDYPRFRAYRRYFFWRAPLTFVHLILYVVFHRYDYWKTLTEDRAVLRQAIYLAGLMRDRGVQRIHSPWANRSAFVASVAARLLGVSYTVQARAHELHRTGRRYALRQKFLGADLVITNCRYNERHIRSTVSAKANLRVVYEGLDLKRLDSPRTQWDVSGTPRILCVARLIEEKGLEYLMRACAALRDDGLTFQCDIIGGAEVPLYADYLVRLKKLHRQLDLAPWVRFHGAQPHETVLDAYGRADLFVLPCIVAANGGRDITPNALLEAMATQLPVIATDLAAIPEIVEDGVSGVLVPPNDAEALAAAVRRLVGDQDLRERLGRNARKQIQERFDLRRNIQQFVAAVGGATR